MPKNGGFDIFQSESGKVLGEVFNANVRALKGSHSQTNLNQAAVDTVTRSGGFGKVYGVYASTPPSEQKTPIPNGQDLWNAMASLLSGLGTQTLKIQQAGNWPEIKANVLLDIMKNPSKYWGSGWINVANSASSTYIHVYPTPSRNLLQADWRIGINLKPDSIATAVPQLAKIQDAFPCIEHFKFLAPGKANKPDSVNIYLKYDSGSYPTLLNAVEKATDGMRQQGFSLLWNEVKPGLAECAESPWDTVSFGEFRCLVTCLAYYWAELYAIDNGGNVDSLFIEYLDYLFPFFGLDVTKPYLQGPFQKNRSTWPNVWEDFWLLADKNGYGSKIPRHV